MKNKPTAFKSWLLLKAVFKKLILLRFFVCSGSNCKTRPDFRNCIKLISSIFVFFILLNFCFSESTKQIIENANNAVDAENWDAAIKILKEGIEKDPDNYILFLNLGLIYYEKDLYKPAYEYFKKGLKLKPLSNDLLFYASYSAAALHKNDEALEYIKAYLRLSPRDRTAASSYGWLCFKTHNILEGIAALEKNIKTYGENQAIYNTLGTLHSGLFDYRNAKKYYTKAIELAKKSNSYYSASVYFYNKAVLESDFYNFEEAQKSAEEALKIGERDSAYLMLGELEEKRNNFSKALALYMRAAEIDNTPMGKLNCSSLFLSMGNFEKAEPIIKSISEHTNEYWISNYGMSVNEFKSSLYLQFKQLYKLKYNFEKTKLDAGFFARLNKISNLINYNLKYLYYSSVYKIYQLKIAKEYKNNDSLNSNNNSYKLYINEHYYMAFKEEGHKAVKYLQEAEKIETAFIPKSRGFYKAEKAYLLKDLKLLNEGINEMNPEWEKYLLKDFYAKGILLAKKNASSYYYFYIKSLFDINASAFLEYNIKLPVNIKIDSGPEINNFSKKIKKLLNYSRFSEDKNSPLSLIVKFTNNKLNFELKNKNNYTIKQKSFSIKKINQTEIKKCINELNKDFFILQ